MAARDGKTETVLALISNGANIHTHDEESYSPLHLAADNGHIETVFALISRGARIDALDINRQTPLHAAALNDHKAMIKMTGLQAQGAFCEPRAVSEDLQASINQYFRNNPTWHNYDEHEFKGSERLNLLSLKSPTTVVEEEAFADCKNLLKLEIANGIIIQDNAFKDCGGLSVVIIDERSPFQKQVELERIGIMHEVNIMTPDDYGNKLKDFKNTHSEFSRFTPRQTELLFCLSLTKQPFTLKQFAAIFGKDLPIPYILQPKIADISYDSTDTVTQAIYALGLFSAKDYANLNLVKKSFEL